ncbi:hypothetical protein [Vibrio algarum]|uniref:Cytochrome c domain-containing protein n=1 Tax=Vibrio algarum TaxID=3020714 RepID=A0ABT4YXB6_9VIBR|nr:hypothetical protein [Vibrio sp. KJ40-1]MDB1125623.1 hypothetical protein [Vibrio sp. KJ40-1]
MKWLTKSIVCGVCLISVSVLASNGETANTVTPDSTDIEKGQHLFRTAGGYGCSTCHGLYAQGGGNAGGNIRGKGLEALNLILEKEPTMVLLGPTLSADDRRRLSIYVTELGKLNLIEWTIENGVIHQNGNIVAHKSNQLVILNKTFNFIEFNFPKVISQTTVTINPYETLAFQWHADDKPLDLKQPNYDVKMQTINELK